MLQKFELLTVLVSFEQIINTFSFTNSIPTFFTVLGIMSVESILKLNVVFTVISAILSL